MARRLISRSEIKSKKNIHFSNEHLARLEKVGRWPRRIKISHKCVMWDEDEVDAEIEARAAARDVRPAAEDEAESTLEAPAAERDNANRGA